MLNHNFIFLLKDILDHHGQSVDMVMSSSVKNGLETDKTGISIQLPHNQTLFLSFNSPKQIADEDTIEVGIFDQNDKLLSSFELPIYLDPNS